MNEKWKKGDQEMNLFIFDERLIKKPVIMPMCQYSGPIKMNTERWHACIMYPGH